MQLTSPFLFLLFLEATAAELLKESTYAGDRDVRFKNCLVPCRFECDRPNLRARDFMNHKFISRLTWESIQHGRIQGYDIPEDRGGYDLRGYHEWYESNLHKRLLDLLATGQVPNSTQDEPMAVPTGSLAGPLRMTRWDCAENCAYNCMIENRELRKRLHEQTVHYYGKWPFDRVLGVQELFSSLFSFLNGLPFLVSLMSARDRAVRSAPRGMAWAVYWLVSVNTWVQSGVFHARDNPVTMALDYHCASMSLAYGLGMAIFANMPIRWSTLRATVTAFMLPFLYWAGLVSYLSFVDFDFGFFMKCSVLCGVVGSLSWLVFFIRHRKERPYAWKALAATWLVYLVLPLELLDFPPFFDLLDAHAIWHLLTVPNQMLMVSFHRDFLRHDSKKD